MTQPGRSSRNEARIALEDGAAAAAASVLGAQAHRMDTGPAQGARDFDMVFPDGSREPFEVTRSAQEATRRTWDRVFREPLSANLTRFWHVSVPEHILDTHGRPQPLDRHRYERELVPILRALEETGVERFEEQDLWLDPRLFPFRQALIDLNVDFAGSLDPPEAETTRLHLSPGGGGAVDIDSIAEAVEREARKKDNLAKLGQPEHARHRHLCVVIDLSDGLTHMAMRIAFESGQVPKAPRLPQPITTAWAMTATELLVVEPPEPWRGHSIPRDVRERPGRWLVS